MFKFCVLLSSVYALLRSENSARKIYRFGIEFDKVFWLVSHFGSCQELPVVPWFQRLEFLGHILVGSVPWMWMDNWRNSNFLDPQMDRFANMDALFHQDSWKWNRDLYIVKSLFGCFHQAWVFEAASWWLMTAGVKSKASCSWACKVVGCSCKSLGGASREHVLICFRWGSLGQEYNTSHCRVRSLRAPSCRTC